MMLREFDILIWSCLNIKELVFKVLNEKDAQKSLLTRLLMTAFYLKEKLSQKEDGEAIKAFFAKNFPQFLGKYTTEWLILEEPDLKKITPKILNTRFCELKNIYEKLIHIEHINDDDEDDQNKDFNKMVEELGEEINRVEQLRRQLIEKDERRMK